MYHFLASCVRPIRFWVLGLVGVALAWAVHTNLLPYLLKRILNTLGTVDASTVQSVLLLPILCYLGSGLFITLTFRFYDYIWLNIEPILKKTIVDLLVHRLMGHSQAFYQDHLSGDLAHKVKSIMKGVPDLLKLSIDCFLRSGLAILGAFLSLLHVNWLFSMALGLWVGAFLFGSVVFCRKGKALSAEASAGLSAVFGCIGDLLSGMINLSLFANKDHELKRMDLKIRFCAAKERLRDWFFLKLYLFQGLSFVVYQAFCFFILVQGFKRGLITAGDFALLTMLNMSIVNILWKIADDIGNFVRTLGQVSQGLSVIWVEQEIQDIPGAKALCVSQGEIRFEGIHFGYEGQPKLFDGLSLTIEAGQKVGLVGYSGSGKSSLLKLLLRFYTLQAGRILIDGQDISLLTQDSIRQNISIIPQEPVLFHRTIEENIRYGRLDASDDALRQAAKDAYAHFFIEQIPLNYKALVGERGVKLSGGEKQRIALARALLKNAPILILDEATSQLDSMTEVHIQRALHRLMEGKTSLVIAHRLSTLLSMDRIIVFEAGSIVQDGSHEVLLSQGGGLYKKLWDAQVGGFLIYESGASVV